MPSESAIVIPVPEAESLVGKLRSLYDPVASLGLPAHITLLYPFAPPSRVGSEIEALRQLFRKLHSFEFALTEFRRFPATAYLHPEPADRFIELTRMLPERWPDFPPYGGAFSTVIPHLTVADRSEGDVLDRVQVEPRQISFEWQSLT